MIRQVFAVFVGLVIVSCTPPQSTRQSSGVMFTGGSGGSFNEAVVISGVTNKSEGVASEYTFISKIHGKRGEGWHLVGQTLVREKNKVVDVVEIQLGSDSDRRIYYFDVSGFLGLRR
jgi:hypothetical protein